jgi:hypothetical protein
MKDIVVQRISSVQRKLLAERLMKGLAFLAIAFIGGSLLSSYLLARMNFSDDAIFWTRLVGAAVLLALFVKYLFAPIYRRPSQRGAARFLEERHPGLADRLSTSVEVEEQPEKYDPEIRALLRKDAGRALNTVPQTRFLHPRASLSSVLIIAVSAFILAYLLSWGPAEYGYSLNRVLLGWLDRETVSLYAIEVSPGNTTVGKRSDVRVTAALKGFNSNQTRLMARYENSPGWEPVLMEPAGHSAVFSFDFLDVRDQIDYYVEAAGIRSGTFRVTVSETPGIEKLTIVLKHPAYSGLSETVLEDHGDISALKGTVAQFLVKPTQNVRAAALRFENGEEVPLQETEGQELRGEFKLSQADYYRIHFQDEQQFWSPVSDEFEIEVVENQAPILSFVRPGRDQKVSNLEEVPTQLRVEDDYGVNRLSMFYSVNGGPEKEVRLDVPRNSRSFSTSHTFYMEEFEVEPGDFVSYYARATDAVTSSVTDIYFLEVEPYDREFYQSQQGGGMAGGQGGEQEMMLSKRQKELIAATFKLQNERSNYSGSEFRENSQTLALLQQRLQNETATILDRIKRRGIAESDPRFRSMSRYLEEAIKHMQPAEQHLNRQRPGEALPEEQKSYQQLLRAEAQFKEIQVAYGQSQGGGQSSAQDLADLVDLELDQTKNQYETLQQNRGQSAEQEVDEALQKLKELARRQEQQLERKRQAAGGSAASGEGQQRQLAEEAERLARQLERLSREKRDQQMEDIVRNLKQAAQDMRAAEASGRNSEQAQARAQRAMERLRNAQNRLSQRSQSEVAEEVNRLQEQAADLQQRQEEVIDKMGDLQRQLESGGRRGELSRQFRDVLRQKSGMQDDLRRLESDLHRAARRLSSSEPEASRNLKRAGIDIRDQRIGDKMAQGSSMMSRGRMDRAMESEDEVSRELEEVANQIRQARQSLGQQASAPSSRERLQDALSSVGDLVQDLESFRDRADRGQQGSSQGQSQQESSDPSAEGQQDSAEGQQASDQSGGQQSSGQQSSSGRQSSGQQGEAQADGQAAGGQGGEHEGNVGGSSYAGGLPNTSGINPQQLRREWQERLQDAEKLQRMLADNPDLARSAESLAREMRRLDSGRLLSNPEAIDRLKSQVIDGFRQLELELNRAVQDRAASLPRQVSDEDVPAQFRKRVEEYYRSLSNARNR